MGQKQCAHLYEKPSKNIWHFCHPLSLTLCAIYPMGAAVKQNKHFHFALLKAIAVTYLTVTILGLIGCTSIKETPTAAYVAPPISAAPKLYVYRGLSMPTKANVEIQIDGQLVAYLPNNRFTWINVPPGRHTVAVGYPSFPDMRAKLEVDFVEGQSYLIRYDSQVGREMSLFGIHPAPIPGVTNDGRGGYTRIRLFPSTDIARIVEQYHYVVAQP